MDLFRKIFGLDRNDEHRRQCRREPPMDEYTSEDIFSGDPFNRRSFDVFSDPIQMHQYFENQMNEVLKMFGFNGTNEFSIRFPNPPLDGWSQTPPNGYSENPENLRDHFLKPGYEKQKTNYHDKVDKDLDDKVKNGDVSKVLGEKFGNEVVPYEARKPRNYFYGTSQSIRTIQNPDGSVETHRTIRDHEGNEETTVCHKIGDREYCIIKKKDKYGKEEVAENFVDTNEGDKIIFNKPRINQPRNKTDITSDFWSKFF